VLRYNDQRARALPYFEEALRLDPNCLAAYNQLGLLLMEENEPEKARRCFEQALSLKPDLEMTRLVLGASLQKEGDFDAAEAHFRELLAEDPDNLFARMGVASAVQQKGDTQMAVDLLDEVLQANPDQLEAIAGKATVLEKQRRFDEAYALIKPLIDQGVSNGAIAEAYALVCLRTKRYAEPLAYLDQVLADPDLHFHLRRGILFRLGDLHDKLKQPEKAFPYYVSANALKPQRFERQVCVAEADAIIGAFDAGLIACLQVRFPGNESDRPVFIVGMPRSGTTLTEQILASHPDVFGAGELRQLGLCFRDLLGDELPMNADALREHLLGLPPEAFEHAAQSYLDHLTELSQGGEFLRVTDKMPANFRYLGLIRVLFPNATVIHCRRHPLDTCLSCFSHDFRHLEFTNDLDNLGLYYRQYQRFMAHWKSIPELGLLEAVYEETVAEQETVSRRLVAHAGLDWDPKCLDFHTSERHVRTASYEQVRNPIYTSSLQRWKPYEDWLEPLKHWIELP
ncbi:MAG: sulfotransferase, partial [Candidatus Sericytochromatia bacterium]